MAALTLELIDLRPGPADDHSWMPPFDEAVGYANPHWWNPLLYDAEHPWYVQVLEAAPRWHVSNSTRTRHRALRVGLNIAAARADVPAFGTPEACAHSAIEAASVTLKGRHSNYVDAPSRERPRRNSEGCSHSNPQAMPKSLILR